MTGCMAQALDTNGKITSTWKTGLDAIEMKPVSGHEGWYYGESDVYSKTAYNGNLADGVTGQPNEYALVVGYNKTAEISAAKQGLQWVDAYKAAYCASFAYPKNATFDGEGGAKQVVTLHEDKFTAVPKKPEAPLTNYTMKVAFSESLPTWEVPHLLGSFDSWNTTWSAEAEVSHRMTTTDSARKIWTYKFDSIIPDSYDITMSLDYTVTDVPSTSAYSWTKPDEWKAGNLKMSVNTTDGNNFVMADADAYVATVSAAAGSVFADPSIKYDYTFKLVNTAATPLAATFEVGISGTINSWAFGAMTPAADVKSYTITLQAPMGSYEFGFRDHTDNWDHKVALADGNLKVTLPAKAVTITVTADMSNFAIAKDATGYVQTAIPAGDIVIA
jgi:hypothetical protein